MRIVSKTIMATCVCLILSSCESSAERKAREEAAHARTVKIVGGVAVIAGLLAGIAIGSVRRSKPNAAKHCE